MTMQQNMEQEVLKFANVLQTSLDLDKLIELFAENLSPFVAHDSLTYSNPNKALECIVGDIATHTCSYEVKLHDKELGNIILSRKKPFTENELQCFETLLCSIIYPLNNSLLYLEAIKTAFKDHVTGVNNRAAMESTLEREIELAHRNSSDLTLIMLDIDRFKNINDNYGHVAGDAVLHELGKCLIECTRRSDIVFRYGGEEFAAILNSTNIDGANFLANRIRSAVEKRPFSHNGVRINVTISAGVSCIEKNYGSADLIQAADQALYQAKNQGRNRVIVYNPEYTSQTVNRGIA